MITAATDYGRDLAGTLSLSTTRTVFGMELLVNALIRRVTTKRGVLFFHRNYGISILDLLGQGTAPNDLRRYATDIVGEIENDPRVFRGSVQARVRESKAPDQTSIISVEISGEAALGPFEFVITVDKVTLSILKIQTGTTS
jgi:hypothetical protein